jgi:hypothetical protein
MTTKEIIKTIEDLTGLYFEISINDSQTEVTSTYNPEKTNYQYFIVCNELESYFTEMYLEGNDLLLDKVLKLLHSGFELWNSLKVESFYINLNFDNKELEHLTSTLTNEQLLQIAEIKTHYIQSLISKIENLTTTPKTKPVFKLSEKKGAKTDLIRVLNALYELRLFNKTDGQIPTKQEFIETMGEYLGVDLSKYHSNLSQALQNQPLEVNLKIFEEMKEATQKAHYQTKTK